MKTLDILKNYNEDFEWYPTTLPIMQKIKEDIGSKSGLKILDIGAGDGRVLKYLEITNSKIKNSLFAIEKSLKHIENYSDILTIGTDFSETTLIDKPMDIIYCNPPYSTYELWIEKIILEANCKTLYLTIPTRWKNSDIVKSALNTRGCNAVVLDTFSFMDAKSSNNERVARANVDLIKIKMDYEYYEIRENRLNDENFKIPKDPFDVWFEKYFIKEDKERKKHYSVLDNEEINSKINNSIVKGRSVTETLVEIYNNEFSTLIDNYKTLSLLSPEVMREIDIDVKDLKEKMKYKISNLKNYFWKELFDKLETVKEKMTSNSRDKLYNKISTLNNMDFTLSNIYAVLIMVIKESNTLIESQLIDLYYNLANQESIKLYKSNKHFINDTWRFNSYDLKEKNIKYVLDYRIILNGYYGLTYDWSNREKMSDAGIRVINDIFTIANNLGFKTDRWADECEWVTGKSNFFYKKTNYAKNRLKKGDITTIGKIEDVYYIENGNFYQYKIKGNYYHGKLIKLKSDLLLEAKAYKNGNLHLKINRELLSAINIEASRLLGWIKKPQDATDEFEIDIKTAQKYFNCNEKITNSILNILPNYNNEAQNSKPTDTQKDNKELTLLDFAL